jgi:hypothetical protein
VTDSGFTRRQRLTVLLMVVAIIVVFAMLTGLIVTSIQGWDSRSPAATLPFVSVVPAPTALPSPTAVDVPEEGIWSQVQAARLFDQIAHQVETLRGLAPRAEVPLSFLDGREMTALVRQLYARDDPQTQWLPYTALGLFPSPSVSVEPRPAAGIYLPEQEQLYVATGREESTADDQALLAHAYAHALQDQHFDLGAMDARATTTDATLAIQALVEGDATLLTAFYRYEDLAVADWEHLVELILQAEQPGYGEEMDRSEAWSRLQRFPYHEGRRFAHALFRDGGWQALNDAYTDPPRSTEQVLHPERYLDQRDVPPRVVVPDLDAVLGEGWTMLVQDTLGEFAAGLYLDAVLPGEMAWQAADGWDGDTFVVWEHDDGSRVLIWRTIWDSTAEAAEFERALVALVPHQYVTVWPFEPPGELVGRWWETDAGAVTISRAARYVTTVQAPDADALASVVEDLP